MPRASRRSFFTDEDDDDDDDEDDDDNDDTRTHRQVWLVTDVDNALALGLIDGC